VYDHLYTPAGGVIQQFSFEGDTKLENAELVYRTWKELTAVPISDGASSTR
jgi:hypothetical protein